jgi:hypothetical protein
MVQIRSIFNGGAEFGARTGGAQRALPKLSDDDFRIQLGADDRDLGIPDVKFPEALLGEVNHPVEVTVAAPMPLLPRITGQPIFCAPSTMRRKSALTASRSKYSVPVPR